MTSVPGRILTSWLLLFAFTAGQIGHAFDALLAWARGRQAPGAR